MFSLDTTMQIEMDRMYLTFSDVLGIRLWIYEGLKALFNSFKDVSLVSNKNWTS